MLKYQYDLVSKPKEQSAIITSDNLVPLLKDRTLLYGYTCERKSFHVYMRKRVIHTVIYESTYNDGVQIPIDMKEIEVKNNGDFIPDKRLYPELCDYTFCRILKAIGYELPFTTWMGMKEDQEKDFYGLTLEDYERIGRKNE